MKRPVKNSIGALVAFSGLVAAATVAALPADAAAAGCSVGYTVSSQWQGGFGATVAVTNLGAPVNGWTPSRPPLP